MKNKFRIIIFVMIMHLNNLFAQSTYIYDKLNRFIQITHTNGTIVRYTYDELGNRTSKIVTTATYTITASSNATAGGSVSGGGSYSNGDKCTVVATANTGYAFSNWTENGSVVSTNASYSFTVSGARTLVANFVAKTGLSEVETYGIKVYSANNKAIVEGADGWDVSVVDLSGRTIFIKRSDSDKFEIGIPVPGLYLIRLSNDGKICSEKVIIR